MNKPLNKPVVFFDDVCKLCSAAVQFILKRERAPDLRFAPLHGETFRALEVSGKDMLPNSIVLFENGKLFAESAAVLRIARRLRLPWRYLALPGWFIPAFVRDPIYRFIAHNRYRWFGKKETCYLPPPDLKARFLP